MPSPYIMPFTAGPDHIDMNGHVNNAVWLQWVQDIGTAHWEACARPEDVDAYLWFVTRHELDYRGNVTRGDTVTARTWIPDPPQGARFVRRVEFVDAAGKVLVAARSVWAMIDKATGRPTRIPPAVSDPFRTA